MQNYYNYKTHDNYRPTRMNQTKEIIKKLKTKTWYIRVKSRRVEQNSKIQFGGPSVPPKSDFHDKLFSIFSKSMVRRGHFWSFDVIADHL